MREILVCNHKGGVGKTSVALHLASWLAQQGKPVAAIDTDPQGSLAQWHGRSKSSGLDVPEVLFLRGDDYVRRRAALAKRFEYLVVDTPPFFSANVQELAEGAFRVVVPVTPGGFELDALTTTLGMRCPRERMLFVLNRADTGKVCRAVREHLLTLGRIAELRQYAVFREASLAGGSVLHLAPKSKAADDVRALAQGVLS